MRLIDADKLPKYTGYALSASDVAIAVENAPTVDAVPVVFCKKCKHWDREMALIGRPENERYCPMIDLITDAGFYCKNGERKGGDE